MDRERILRGAQSQALGRTWTALVQLHERKQPPTEAATLELALRKILDGADD
jgi:hypothetical protein